MECALTRDPFGSRERLIGWRQVVLEPLTKFVTKAVAPHWSDIQRGEAIMRDFERCVVPGGFDAVVMAFLVRRHRESGGATTFRAGPWRCAHRALPLVTEEAQGRTCWMTRFAGSPITKAEVEAFAAEVGRSMGLGAASIGGVSAAGFAGRIETDSSITYFDLNDLYEGL